jgi:hypothetical protein
MVLVYYRIRIAGRLHLMAVIGAMASQPRWEGDASPLHLKSTFYSFIRCRLVFNSPQTTATLAFGNIIRWWHC